MDFFFYGNVRFTSNERCNRGHKGAGGRQPVRSCMVKKTLRYGRPWLFNDVFTIQVQRYLLNHIAHNWLDLTLGGMKGFMYNIIQRFFDDCPHLVCD